MYHFNVKFYLIIAIFLFIFFPINSYAKYKDSQYSGKEPLLDKTYSRNTGFNMEWLLDCGGHGAEVKRADKEIKKLSYADYRKVRQGRAEWNSANKVAIQCSGSRDTVNRLNEYVNTLRIEVNNNNGSRSSSTKNNNSSKLKFCINNELKLHTGVNNNVYEKNSCGSKTEIYSYNKNNRKECKISNGRITSNNRCFLDYKFNDSERYIGEFYKKDLDGFGLYIWPDGYHVGYWKNGEMTGNGLQVIYKPFEVLSGKFENFYLIEEYEVFGIKINNIQNKKSKININEKEVDTFTYCKKKNGEIYIPENEIVSRSYCLSDEYVTTENAYKKYLKSTNSNLKNSNKDIGGIGIVIEKNDLGYEIIEVVKGYPGFYAGLKKGDLIHSIDDLVIGRRYTLDAIINMIMGKINTEVKISVINKELEFKTFYITRQNITALIKDDVDNSDVQNQKEKIDRKLDTNLADIKTFNKKIDKNILKLQKINNNFDPTNYIEDIFNSYSIFESEFEKFKLSANAVNNLITRNLNLFSVVEIDKLEAKYKLIEFSLEKSISLLENYSNTYSIYEKNKKLRLDYLNNDEKDDVIILDIEGVYYTKNNVNLRMGPNVQSKIVTTIPQGGVVEVLRAASGSADWVQVKYKDILGYIYFPLLSKEKIESVNKDKPENKPKVYDFGQQFEKEFSEGIGYLNSGEYNNAEIYFKNYIVKNPSSDLIASAYYWLGETYIFLEDYKNAEQAFSKGYEDYPESEKAIYMLARLASTQVSQEKIDAACSTLHKFQIRFPDNWQKDLKETLTELDCAKYKDPDLESDNILNNIYYNDLIKIKELIDLELITSEEYEKRKVQIIDQIINLDLSNRAGFLIKLLNENLITQDDFQYIFNSLSSSLDIEEGKNLNLEDENFSVAEMLKELRDQNSNDEENKNKVRKRGDNKKEDKIIQTLSVSEINVLRQQLSNCWNAPAGAIIDVGMFVSINAKVLQNGNVVPNSVRLIDTNISKSNPFYEPITDSAMRTLLNPECTPLNLPSDKYEQWKNITITFDYSIMKGY